MHLVVLVKVRGRPNWTFSRKPRLACVFPGVSLQLLYLKPARIFSNCKAERVTHKPLVGGSNPSPATRIEIETKAALSVAFLYAQCCAEAPGVGRCYHSPMSALVRHALHIYGTKLVAPLHGEGG